MKKNNMKLFSSKHTLIEKANSTMVVMAVVAAIIVSFSIVISKFMIDQISYNNRVIGAKEDVRDVINENIVTADELSKSLSALEASDNLIKAQGSKKNSVVVLDALPSKYDFPAIATSMALLAESTGVTLDNFGGSDNEASAEQDAAEPTTTEIPFEVTVKGSYGEVQEFIRNLEFSIRSMDIQTIAYGGSDAELEAELEINTFYQPSKNLEVTTRKLR